MKLISCCCATKGPFSRRVNRWSIDIFYSISIRVFQNPLFEYSNNNCSLNMHVRCFSFVFPLKSRNRGYMLLLQLLYVRINDTVYICYLDSKTIYAFTNLRTSVLDSLPSKKWYLTSTYHKKRKDTNRERQWHSYGWILHMLPHNSYLSCEMENSIMAYFLF